MKAYIQLANVLVLIFLAANIILPQGTIHRALMGVEQQCHAMPINTLAPIASAVLAFDPPAQPDGTALYEAFQVQFWTWAWSASAYSTEQSTTTIDAVGVTPTGEDPHVVTAWLVSDQGHETVGTGSFTTTAVYTLATQSYIHEDEEHEVTVSTTVTSMVAAGTFIRAADAQAKALVAGIVHVTTTDQNNQTSTHEIRGFAPVQFARSVADANAIAYGMSLAAAPQEEDNPNLGKGGIAPCQADLPYEQQSCECQCTMDRSSCESNCSLILRGALYGIGLASAVVAPLCWVACFLVGPECLACFLALIKASAKLLGAALAAYSACMGYCHLDYEDCMSDCQ
jgi:hypothetical protein